MLLQFDISAAESGDGVVRHGDAGLLQEMYYRSKRGFLFTQFGDALLVGHHYLKFSCHFSFIISGSGCEIVLSAVRLGSVTHLTIYATESA